MARSFLFNYFQAAFLAISVTACGLGDTGDAGSPSRDLPPEVLGISFVPGSTSIMQMDRDGKTYEVDLAAHTVREILSPAGTTGSQSNTTSSPATTPAQSDGATIFARNCATCHGVDAKGMAGAGTPDFTSSKTQLALTDEQIVTTIENGKAGTMMPAWASKLSQRQILAVAEYLRSLAPSSPPGQASGQVGASAKVKVYQPGDDNLFSLPTGRRLEQHGLYVNFAHRFAFDPAFSGIARGYALLGLDGFSLSSFGLRYGVTKNFSVSIYRSPTFISRPIQMLAAYNLLAESDGAPLNMAGRLSIEGQNDFTRNFAGSLELILSRSLGRHAQLYFVPTASLGARHLFSPNSYSSSDIPNLPGHTTFSTGAGGALDIRPTVALVAEVIPTLLNGVPLGIHRAAYAFGIQKKIWRHSFTLGFATSPATTVSQRAATSAALLNNPEADEPHGLFIGFDLTRQLF